MPEVPDFDGHITCQNLLKMTADNIANPSGFIESRANKVNLVGRGFLDNMQNGQIRGKKGLELDFKKDIQTSSGKLISEDWITLQANSVDAASAILDGENIKITALKEIKTDAATKLIADRMTRLTAETILLKSPVLTQVLFLNSSKGLTFEGPQSVRYLSIHLKDCPFNYKEGQLQATGRFSLTHDKSLELMTPLKIKGAMDITASVIYNKTTLAADGKVTLTGTAKHINFPIWNTGIITSNKQGISLHGKGFRHWDGKVSCAGDFKFDGTNLQLLSAVNIGGDTRLLAPDQNDNDLNNKSTIGLKSIIDYSKLSVGGLLHLTLPSNKNSFFNKDFNIPGKLVLKRAGKSLFWFFHDIIAEKGLEIDMSDASTTIGLNCRPIKMHTKKGKVDINVRDLDIVRAEICAQLGITVKVQRKQLHIGRGEEQIVQMIGHTGYPVYGGCPHLNNMSFPFHYSNGTLLFTEGPVTISSPEGVRVENADLYAGRDVTIYTHEPVINEGGKFNFAGNVSIVDNFSHPGKLSNAIFQNLMMTKTSHDQYMRIRACEKSRGTFSLTHPTSHPGEVNIGGDLTVKSFENFASKAHIKGKIKDPTSLAPVKVKQEDFLATVTTPQLHNGFWHYYEGGQWPIFKFLKPLERRISSNITIGQPLVLTYSGPGIHKFEGAIHAPRVNVLIKNGATFEIGAKVNYQRPATRQFEAAKMFTDVGYRISALFKPDYTNIQPVPEPVTQPKNLVLLDDKTTREIEIVPTLDKTSGFSALLKHLNVEPSKARETAVKKILDALENPKIQSAVCKLIAPEIMDGTFSGTQKYKTLPDAQEIRQKLNLAEEDLRVALSQFCNTFGVEATKGKTADQLLESMKDKKDASQAHGKAYADLRGATLKLNNIKTLQQRWARLLETVEEFIIRFVAKPSWELSYTRDNMGANPTGVMHALSYVLNMNLKIYKENGNTLSPVHGFEWNPKASTIEMVHGCISAISTDNNQFNLLKKIASPTSQPSIYQPIFPISFNMDLPPIVVMTPTGWRLALPHEQCLFHHLMNIEALPDVFRAQIGPSCLSPDQSDNRETYFNGLWAIYHFYQKHLAPLTLQNGTNKSENGETCTALVAQNQCKGILDIINALPQQEQQQYGFMIPHYVSDYEDGVIKRKVLLPLSVLSPVYDNPYRRNSDGGMFANEVHVLGDSSDETLRIFSTLYGEKINNIKVDNLTVERTVYEQMTYVANSGFKSGGWFGNDKHWVTIVALLLKTPQDNTGIFGAGEEGELNVDVKNLELLNGAQGIGGAKNHIKAKDYKSTAGIEQKVIRSEGGAKGDHYITHGTDSTIHPCRWVFPSGATIEIENGNMSGDEFLVQKGDLIFNVTKMHLGAPRAKKYLGMSVTKEGKAVVVEHRNAEIASQPKFLALDGDVYFKIKDKLTGEAPIFLGKTITFDGNVDLNSLLLKMTIDRESVTESMFSSTRTTSTQESPMEYRAIFEGQQVIFKNGEAHLSGPYIKAVVKIVDDTISGLKIDPTVNTFYYHHNTDVKTPLSSAQMGGKGWQQIQIQPVVETPILERTSKKGKMSFTNAILNVDEIKGNYELLTRHMESHHETWSHYSQVIPQAVVIVIAMVAAYYTGGLLAPLLQGLGTIGTMIVAAVQTMVNMAASNLGQTGDPEQTIENLLRKENMEAVLKSGLAAGVANGLGGALNVNMAPGQRSFFDNLQKFAVQNGARAAVQTAMGKSAEKAFAEGFKQTFLDAAAATGAGWIGANVNDPLMHKLFHGLSAAGIDVAGGGNHKTAMSAASAAVIAETAAETLIDPDKIMKKVDAEGHPESDKARVYQNKLEEHKMWVKALTIGVITACGGNAAAAEYAAENAMQHDFLVNQQRHIAEQMKSRKEMLEKKAEEEKAHEKEPKKNKKPNKILRSTRKTKQASVKITVDSDDLYLNIVDQQQKLPQEDYISLAAQNVEEHINPSLQDTPQPAKLNNSVMITFADPHTGEPTEMTWDQGVKELNRSIDIASFIPNPFGMACLAVGLSRDLYSNKTTVGEILFDTALGIGAVKAIQWTCRGIKVLYQSGKTALVHLTEKISSQFKNPFAYQEALLQKIFGPSYGAMARQLSNQNQVPFVGGLRSYGYHPEDIQYGNLLLLGDKTGSYLGHNRALFGRDSSIECLRQGVQNWAKKPNGALAVGVHGNEQGVFLNRMAVHTPQNNPTREVLVSRPLIYRLEYAMTDHKLLAKIIKRNPGFNKNNLVAMLSCQVGKAEFAQNLANALGARVLAPTEVVWPYADGSLLVAAMKNILLNPKPDFSKLGQFKIFYPKNVQTPLHPVKTPAPGLNLGVSGQPLDALSKKLQGMRNNPKGDWHISDLQFIAERYGITYRQNSTSHVTFSYPNVKQVVAPARKPMKPVYIKQFLEMLESVSAQQALKP